MADEIDYISYYDKQGVKKSIRSDSIKIPSNIYQSVIDNVYATLNFIGQSYTDIDSDEACLELSEVCNKAIVPYSKVIEKYGYELFISDVSFENEKINISCMLREI